MPDRRLRVSKPRSWKLSHHGASIAGVPKREADKYLPYRPPPDVWGAIESSCSCAEVDGVVCAMNLGFRTGWQRRKLGYLADQHARTAPRPDAAFRGAHHRGVHQSVARSRNGLERDALSMVLTRRHIVTDHQRVYASRERAAAVTRRCPCHAVFSTSCPHVTTSHAAHLRRSRRCITCTRSFIRWTRRPKPGSPTTSHQWPLWWREDRTGGTRW
jgi:hypothetical protein